MSEYNRENPDIARLARIQDFLRREYGPGFAWRPNVNGRIYVAIPRLYDSGAIILCEEDVESGVEQEWMYESLHGARAALAAWDPSVHAEPQGWVRHRPSMRRREHGDPAKETVRA